jgi:TPR repeat protein
MSDKLAETFHACRKAAEQEDAAAQYVLGLKFYYGENR